MINRGSLHLGTFAHIPLKVHWTFIFIILFVIGVGVREGRAPYEIMLIIILVLVSFLCVVLHEYGHALMARKFNVRTIDIILSPIGGLARLERLPSRPIHEFYVAIAGPLVNIAIAIFLSIILWVGAKPVLIDLNASVSTFNNWGAYLSIVVYINLMLFLFNLIPAFPMDGGRILRSLLSMRMGKKKSTLIASYIGYAIAIVFIISGVYYAYYTLSIIGVFVMFMARGERISAKHEHFLMNQDTSLSGLSCSVTVGVEESMVEVLRQNEEQGHHYNLVLAEDSRLIGVITPAAIDAFRRSGKDNASVAEYVEPNYTIMAPTNLQELLSFMNEHQLHFVVIDEDNHQYSIVERMHIVQRMRAGE